MEWYGYVLFYIAFLLPTIIARRNVTEAILENFNVLIVLIIIACLNLWILT